MLYLRTVHKQFIMNTRYQFLFSLLVLILLVPRAVNAQVASEWQPVFLQVTGDNHMDGVEASFQINACNGEDVIYVKFINHNNYPVKVEWFDAVFTQDLTWINKEQASDKKSLTIPANKEAKGECSGNLFPELYVKVKTFVAEKKNFKRYHASQLMVIAVK